MNEIGILGAFHQEFLKPGATTKSADRAVAQRLGVRVSDVTRVREKFSVNRAHNGTSRMDKILPRLDPQPDGHTFWLGQKSHRGSPVVRHMKTFEVVAHTLYENRVKRPRFGSVMVRCGIVGCLTPEHLWDELERREHREALRVAAGMPASPWDVCVNGEHDWDTYGRVRPNLGAYCQGCVSAHMAEVRKARKEAEKSCV